MAKFCHLATEKKKIGAVTCGKDGFGKEWPTVAIFHRFFF